MPARPEAVMDASATPVIRQLNRLFPDWGSGVCLVRDSGGEVVGSFCFTRVGGDGMQLRFYAGALACGRCDGGEGGESDGGGGPGEEAVGPARRF